jgi:hypothetical protein
MRPCLLPIAVGVTVLLAGCASVSPQSPPLAAPVAKTNRPAGYAEMVLHDGDTVHAGGRVVSVPGRPVRFCAPVAEGGVGYLPGKEPAPAYCDLGVNVTGVDLATLTDRHSKDGAVEGQAELTGIYRAGTVTVSKQSAPNDPWTPSPPDQPPCAAPSGGWPKGPTGENIDVGAITSYAAKHPGVLLEPADLRPSDNQVIAYAVVYHGAAEMTAALRPTYGKRLCIGQSRYTAAQLAKAYHDLDFNAAVCKAANVNTTGHGLTPQGQVNYELSMPFVTPDLAKVADAQPAGLVLLQPWLVPVSLPSG